MTGHEPRKRPKIVSGQTVRINTGCGNLYVTINKDENGLFEIFSSLGKTGQCGAAQIEAICRSITIGFRAGVDPNVYVKQLKDIRCPSPGMEGSETIHSCADAISRVIEIVLKEEEKEVS
jgi:ribonucleoside-diphosphate reductase alpha chain